MRRVSAVHGSKAGSMAKRQKVEASGVDFLLLCEDIVHKMKEIVKGGKLINARQCKDLAGKLSDIIAWIRMEVDSCDPKYKAVFAPLLLALYRNYVKAEVLVMQCGEDWCAAASVFQYRNWVSFDYILECVNKLMAIYFECAKELSATITSMRNLGSTPMEYSLGASQGSLEDKEEVRKRLKDLASGPSSSSFRIFGFSLPDRAALKEQHLARFLLKGKQFRSGRFETSLEDWETFLWEKENEPRGTWGDVKFLGAGSGASGVLKTSWLGVPCAKKEFHGEVCEAMFMKEVRIMAQLNHPCIVDFICYGNGEKKGDRFIAMELMEKSLFDLIMEQKGMHFSLDVALDIIWQIASGVCYLHEMGVAHRDLKPHNVVVKMLKSPYHEDYYCVKLVDFGTCKSEVEASKSNTITYPGIGTTRYRAPEVHPSAHPRELGRVEWFKADAYSFAMTCAHILTLKEPYEELKSLSTLYTEILRGRRPILPRECPKPELVDLVEQCWSTMVSERPNFSTIDNKLRSLMFNNMRKPISEVTTLVGNTKTSSNVVPCDIKKELCSMKEEGHTSFFTAQNGSLCNEAVSQERDSKHEVQLDIVDTWRRSRPRHGLKRNRSYDALAHELDLPAPAMKQSHDSWVGQMKNNVSKYTGVRFRNYGGPTGEWTAETCLPVEEWKRNKVSFGDYKSEYEAARAIDAAFHYYRKGPYNFPDSPMLLETQPSLESLEGEEKLRAVKDRANWLAANATHPFTSLPSSSIPTADSMASPGVSRSKTGESDERTVDGILLDHVIDYHLLPFELNQAVDDGIILDNLFQEEPFQLNQAVVVDDDQYYEARTLSSFGDEMSWIFDELSSTQQASSTSATFMLSTTLFPSQYDNCCNIMGDWADATAKSQSTY